MEEYGGVQVGAEPAEPNVMYPLNRRLCGPRSCTADNDFVNTAN
jgi:hypothetical protein